MKKITSFFLELVSDEWVKEIFAYVGIVFSLLATACLLSFLVR